MKLLLFRVELNLLATTDVTGTTKGKAQVGKSNRLAIGRFHDPFGLPVGNQTRQMVVLLLQ